MTIEWDHGVHIEGTLLWFDPRRLKEFACVTSARAPLSDKQKRILWGDRTARLVSQVKGRRPQGLMTPYSRSFSLGNLTLELFPSGYMAGASQYQVTLPGGEKLVYSGPFSMTRNRTAEAIEVRRCDTLVMDCTYGHERYRFPPRDQVWRELLDWTADALKANATPIFLVGNPGKAQDLITLLGQAGFPMRVHRGIYAFNKAYRSIGIDLPAGKQFRGHPAHGEVMIWPAHLRKSKAIRNLRRARFAAMTGKGSERGIARRLRVSTVFTWSLRADYDDLLTYVAKAKPKRIVTLGRHADEFARVLMDQGKQAKALSEQPQLDLLSSI